MTLLLRTWVHQSIAWATVGSLLISCVVGCLFYENLEQDSLHSPKTQVSFLDVGQGDASVIEIFSIHPVRKRKVYWVDGGGSTATGEPAIQEWLTNNPVDTVEWILITHGDRDHFEGLYALLNQSVIRKIYIPHELKSTTSIYWSTFLDTVQSMAIPVEKLYRGHTLKMDSTIYFRVLWPTASFLHQVTQKATFQSRNELSYVGQLVMGNGKVLFTGDIEMGVEQQILMLGGDLESDVLKVAHHGSRTSSSLPFVAKVNPTWAVISSDPAIYGHPHVETITALKQIVSDSTRIIRTDEEGSLRFHFEGNRVQRVLKKY